jgi:hypothetical protein
MKNALPVLRKIFLYFSIVVSGLCSIFTVLTVEAVLVIYTIIVLSVGGFLSFSGLSHLFNFKAISFIDALSKIFLTDGFAFVSLFGLILLGINVIISKFMKDFHLYKKAYIVFAVSGFLAFLPLSASLVNML